MSGRIWKVGADVDTDALAPGAYMKLGVEEIARHCMETIRPDFASGVRRNDILVAGPNFGIGSSREQAAAVLVHLGVAAVVAPSYGGLFFRNAFNVGLLLLTSAQADQLRDGDVASVDVEALTVRSASGTVVRCDPIPRFLLDLARAGGLLPALRQRLNPETTS
jgi:3-isopropylmalate/(R)-2-methylmalate dehydratase small subunit